MILSTIRIGSKKTQKGASVVEFALVAPMLFFLLFAILEVAMLFWVNLTMQYAVREGARYSVTGQTNLDPTSNQRYLAVIQKIKDSSLGLYDLVNPRIVVQDKSYGDAGDYAAGMFGAGGETIVLQLNCTWPIMTPLIQPFFADGKYRFTVGATMRNEAF